MQLREALRAKSIDSTWAWTAVFNGPSPHFSPAVHTRSPISSVRPSEHSRMASTATGALVAAGRFLDYERALASAPLARP